MQDFRFPVTFQLKISSLANDFVATDADGRTVAYVRQKMLKLKEDIEVFQDESRSELNYRIQADRWIDFSAGYSFSDQSGNHIGKIGRKGWASLWKAHYEIFDQKEELAFHINEENGWVKVMDGILGELPIIGILSGYLFNPKYLVTDEHGQKAARLTKEPSFWGRKFKVEKLSALEGHDDDNIILGLMMMVLLERRRG
jgi:uncharacterized protein YxjI